MIETKYIIYLRLWSRLPASNAQDMADGFVDRVS